MMRSKERDIVRFWPLCGCYNEHGACQHTVCFCECGCVNANARNSVDSSE